MKKNKESYTTSEFIKNQLDWSDWDYLLFVVSFSPPEDKDIKILYVSNTALKYEKDEDDVLFFRWRNGKNTAFTAEVNLIDFYRIMLTGKPKLPRGFVIHDTYHRGNI